MRDLIPAGIEVPFSVAVSGAIFFAFFLAVVVVAYSRKRKPLYQKLSEFPLSDD